MESEFSTKKESSGRMTTLRFVLGLLWLAAAFFGMLLIPCQCLWRARHYRSARIGARRKDFAVAGSLKMLCFFVSGIVVALSGFWWELAWTCGETAFVFFLLGLCLLHREAPIQGLFDDDNEEVLNNGEMLSLWYGGMNEAYCRFQVKLQTSEPFSRSSEKDLEYNFARTEAWAWDDPYLRVSAYYLKGQGAIFLSLLMLLIVGAYIKIFESPFFHNLYAWIPMIFLLVVVMLLFIRDVYREWMGHYRTLACALKEGRDPDLSDRARLAEMRRAILVWGRNNGYVRFNRELGIWELHRRGGRMVG